MIESKRPSWRSPIHAAQWVSSIGQYCRPIRDKPIDELAVIDVLNVLKPIWTRISETGSRLRGRIEAVFDFAKAQGWCSGENPARWRGNLAHILPRQPRIAKVHFAAMPYVPDFVTALRGDRVTVPRLALEFLILAAARSDEVRSAKWNEIDFDKAIWQIPAARMKAGIAHRVPLSPRAVEILRAVHGNHPEFVFGLAGRCMAPATLYRLLPRGATLHGFRSTFADWAAEQTNFSHELREQALAHTVRTAVSRAYARSDLLQKRRELMIAWASHLDAPAASNIVSIAERR